MSETKEVEFKNHLGQVLRPGERAVAVVCGTGRAELRVGRYLGRTENGNVSMEVHEPVKSRIHKETKTLFDDDPRKPAWPAYPSFARYGTPEYNRQRKVYDDRVKEVKARLAEIDSEYMDSWNIHIWNTTLQRNKIYPAESLA